MIRLRPRGRTQDYNIYPPFEVWRGGRGSIAIEKMGVFDTLNSATDEAFRLAEINPVMRFSIYAFTDDIRTPKSSLDFKRRILVDFVEL